jgi:hypothetical protein
LLIALHAAFVLVGPAGSCAGPSAVPPIIDFQLASSRAELEHIFGTANSACRPDVIAAMHAANRLDLYLYIPAYLVFLLSFFAALRLKAIGWAAWVGFATALAAALCDIAETAWQLRITGDFPGRPEWLVITWTAATAKWGLLAVSGIAAGLLISNSKRTAMRLLGLVPIFGGLMTGLGLILPGWRPVLFYGVAAGWLAIFFVAAENVWVRPPHRAG